jgi:hypothetical protein
MLHGEMEAREQETTTSKTKTFEKYDTETTVKHAWYTHISYA